MRLGGGFAYHEQFFLLWFFTMNWLKGAMDGATKTLAFYTHACCWDTLGKRSILFYWDFLETYVIIRGRKMGGGKTRGGT